MWKFNFSANIIYERYTDFLKYFINDGENAKFYEIYL